MVVLNPGTVSFILQKEGTQFGSLLCRELVPVVLAIENPKEVLNCGV